MESRWQVKGWQVAGIKDAVTLGLSSLASLDPFNDIDPMFEEESNIQTVNPSGLSAASKYVCEYVSEDESDEDRKWKCLWPFWWRRGFVNRNYYFLYGKNS